MGCEVIRAERVAERVVRPRGNAGQLSQAVQFLSEDIDVLAGDDPVSVRWERMQPSRKRVVDGNEAPPPGFCVL